MTKRKTIRCPHCKNLFPYPKNPSGPFSAESKAIADSMINQLYFWTLGKPMDK